MVVFLGIQPGQVPEEPQPEGLDPLYTSQPPNYLVCNSHADDDYYIQHSTILSISATAALPQLRLLC